MSNPKQRKRYYLGNVPIDDVAEDIVSRVLELVGEKRAVVGYVNPYVFDWAWRDEKVQAYLNQAKLVYPDGWGIVWALRFLGYPIRQRITTVDFFDQFCHQASQKGISLAFFGAEKRIGQEAVRNLKKRYPKLKLWWLGSGYLSFDQEVTILEKIRKLKPEVLLVGLGTPHQERWVQRNLPHLPTGVVWGVGGLFEYYAGKPVAPRFLGRIMLEWLFRLFVEPKRLWRRYTLGNIRFIWQVVRLKRSSKGNISFARR